MHGETCTFTFRLKLFVLVFFCDVTRVWVCAVCLIHTTASVSHLIFHIGKIKTEAQGESDRQTKKSPKTTHINSQFKSFPFVKRAHCRFMLSQNVQTCTTPNQTKYVYTSIRLFIYFPFIFIFLLLLVSPSLAIVGAIVVLVVVIFSVKLMWKNIRVKRSPQEHVSCRKAIRKRTTLIDKCVEAQKSTATMKRFNKQWMYNRKMSSSLSLNRTICYPDELSDKRAKQEKQRK